MATIDDQLRIGRLTPLQRGYYTARAHQITRIILAEKDWQYLYIRDALVDLARCFDGVIFLVHVSPPEAASQPLEETSLDRQQMFLSQFFESTSFVSSYITCIRLEGDSAYNTVALDKIESRLKELRGPNLFSLCPSIA